MAQSSSSSAASSSTKKVSTSASSTSKSSSGSNSGFSLKGTFVNLALLIIVPYLIGVYISNQNLALVQQVLQPLISSVSKTSRPNTTLSAINNIGKKQQPDDEAQVKRSVLSSSNAGVTNQKDYVLAQKCFDHLIKSMTNSNNDENAVRQVFENIDIVMHHNGESQPCGRIRPTTTTTTRTNLVQGMQDLLFEELPGDTAASAVCPLWSNKYHVESFLTRVLHRLLLAVDDDDDESQQKCASTEEQHDDEYLVGLYGYCDRGEAKTPILLDHDKLVRIRQNHDSLPCHFHSQVGVRITNLSLLFREAVSSSQSAEQEQAGACLAANDGYSGSCVAGDNDTSKTKELHLYAVPAGRVFMFAPSHVGQVIALPHITGGDPNQPVELHVLSVQPRIFDITNFFTRDESNEIVRRAVEETRETHRIKRSSTGATGYNINQQRTSESGFDTEGATAMTLKRRGLSLLGFDEYLEGHTDGLQVLRYNLTTAYIPHMDWIDGAGDLVNDYESAEKGGNRYATILLYMSDLTEHDGGETVFVEAWPGGLAEKDRIPMSSAIRQVRESGDADMLVKGSWEETMVAQCRTRLAIRPNSAKAILFYSQKPNGEEDRSSKHGACPVLKGDKWAANLWVWNTPRPGFAGNPRKAKYKDVDDATAGGFRQVVATFQNRGTHSDYDKAELFFQDDLWAQLGPHDPEVRVNTYKGHTWTARVEGRVVKTWTIDDDTEDEPTFVLE